MDGKHVRLREGRGVRGAIVSVSERCECVRSCGGVQFNCCARVPRERWPFVPGPDPETQVESAAQGNTTWSFDGVFQEIESASVCLSLPLCIEVHGVLAHMFVYVSCIYACGYTASIGAALWGCVVEEGEGSDLWIHC